MKSMNLIIVCIFLMAVSSAWCQKIGLLMDSYVVERWRTDQSLFVERVNALGGKCVVEVPHGNAEEQVRLGKKLIAEKVDVLVIVPSDADRAAEIVAEAKKANIPVISYDRMIASKDISLYVSYDNHKVGLLQGQYALDRKPEGNYLFLNGPKYDRNSMMFKNGQMEALRSGMESGKINVVADYDLEDWSELEAIMKVEEYLAGSNPIPDVIIAANDALATGALQVLPEELIGKVILTGQDAERGALRHIVAGHQSMTVYKPIKPLAYNAAESAMKMAKKQPVNSVKMKMLNYEVNAILLDPMTVDKSNYKDTIVKDGHLSMAEIN